MQEHPESGPGRTTQPRSDAAGTMMGLLFGAWEARLVHTAVELGIADHLASMPRDSAFLAAAAQAHEPSLTRLLRALTAIDVLNESEDRILEVSRTGRMVMRRGEHTSRVLDAMRVAGVETKGEAEEEIVEIAAEEQV